MVDTPPEPVRPPPPPPKPPGKVYSKAQLDAINAARGARGQGGLHSIAPNGRVVTTNPLRPEVVLKDHDKRYDPENIPWTEASLPVDRGRILTADRVIKAVLETPITNVMCNQVVAVVESHVYSPDNINVLIPRGTRVIGRCQAFADERVNIQWERMITPTGVNIRFINQLADTSDASGRGGVPGRIEQKFFDRFVLPILATSLDMIGTAARAMMGKAQTSTVDALTGTQSQTKSPMDVAIDQYNDKVVPQGKKYIDEIADVRKVIVVAGGTRLDIVPQEDIYFKGPYEVVRLADVEYDVQRNVRGPVVQETAPPPYSLNPTMGRNAGANGLNIGGQGYSLDPKDTGGAEDPNKALYAPPPMPNAPGVRQQTQQQQQQQQRQQTTGNAMNAFGPQQNTGSGQQGGQQNNTGYPAPAGRRTGTTGTGTGAGGAGGTGGGSGGTGGTGYSTGNGGY